jgi:hypothetical protein
MTRTSGDYRASDLDAEGGGWMWFAGTILGIAGLMRIIDGLWAFRYDGALPEHLSGSLLGTNLDTYGWLFLAVGVVYLLSSFLVLVRSQIGRWVGLFAAAFGSVSAMTWMPYYPIWSLTHILLAVLVFYGLARYGGRPGND